MIRGVLAKIARESWPIVLLAGGALFLVTLLLNLILPQLREGLNDAFMSIPFVRTMISALLGADLGDSISAPMLYAILWVHPVVLSIVWGVEIVLCTRLPAGEIDRGTIDVLLGWPVSRRRLYACEAAACLAAGVVVLACAILGHLASRIWVAGAVPIDWGATMLIVLNLFCVYVAVGGFASLVSSLSERRGRAILVTVGFLLASFLLNFLAQFWTPASHFAFLGVLDYYQPAQVLRGGVLPVGDVTVLLGFGVVTWVIGGEVTARRSICTV